MSVTLGVSLIVLLDVALLAGLACAMAAPRKLRPHVAKWEDAVVESIEHAAQAIEPAYEMVADRPGRQLVAR